jgi:hypothetical protein
MKTNSVVDCIIVLYTGFFSEFKLKYTALYIYTRISTSGTTEACYLVLENSEGLFFFKVKTKIVTTVERLCNKSDKRQRTMIRGRELHS